MVAIAAHATSASARGSEKPPTPIPLYTQSSQYRNWRYSREGLDDIRTELNVKAVERVRAMVVEDRVLISRSALEVFRSSAFSPLIPHFIYIGIPQAQQTVRTPTESVTSTPSANDGGVSSATGSPLPSGPPPAPSEIQYLTVADELSLVAYYLTQIAALCGAFRFPEMVQATAMTYLKRFYLRNTCMDYHPKNVMLTSVFLATKTENYPISIDTFSSKVKTTSEDILSLEFRVSQSLRFEYKVHHAFLALFGQSLDLQNTDVPPERIEAAYQKAKVFARASRLTDLEFIYTPSQIALASFRLADAFLVDSWIGLKSARKEEVKGKARLDARLKRQTNGSHHKNESGAWVKSEEQVEVAGNDLDRDALIECLEEIGLDITAAVERPIDKQAVTEVDKRLRWARNPEKDPTSALYKKRKAAEDAEREQKAAAKAAKRPPTDDSTVFD